MSSNIITENRFDYPTFIRDNGVQALATVIIVGPGGWLPYGILQMDSREKRIFTDDDMIFLRNYANLLITSEVITNSLKHALGDGYGTIGLWMENTGAGQMGVTLWDDGKGLLARQSGGTGIGLIEGLARQVGATVAWGREGGTHLNLSMPAPPVDVVPVQQSA